MTYRRFEDLPVWNDAIDLAVRTFAFTSTNSFPSFSGLRNQMERAVVSISNNIAEGFERGTNQELLSFLYIARGSAGEVRSMSCLMERLPMPASLSAAVVPLKASAESIARQLGRWIESIKDSGHEGSRSRNSPVRHSEQAARRRDAFLSELDRIKADGPGRPSLGSDTA